MRDEITKGSMAKPTHYDLLERLRAWCEMNDAEFVELGTKHLDQETYWVVRVRLSDGQEVDGRGLTQDDAMDQLDARMHSP